MTRLLAALFTLIFCSTLFIRCVDPVIPLIAGDLAVEPETAALLSTAFALPYAIVQPALGLMADMFGKTRLMIVCTLALIATAFIGAAAPNFPILLASRVVAGIAGGGIFPAAIAVVGDLFPLHRRQVAIARLLAAAMIGNLIGAAAAGVVGDLVGWRGVFMTLGLVGVGAAIFAVLGFRGFIAPPAAPAAWSSVVSSYRAIFGNPLAKFCFGTVFVEGIVLFGLFPYVALLLLQSGETRATIAGIVIGSFGIGGFLYTLCVAALLRWLGERRLMRAGGILMGLSLIVVALGVAWPIDFAAFAALGFAFYMLHGVIQVYASELAPAARGATMSLHTFFFFLGHAVGPILYGVGLAQLGSAATLTLGALALAMAGLVCAQKLRRPAMARPATPG